MRGRRRGQMSAGRETHDAHLMRIDAPRRGIAPCDADRLVHVFQRNFVVAVRHPVTEHQNGDAVVAKPAGHLEPLALVADASVPPARTDNDHLSYGPLPLGQEYVIIGDGHVEQNPVAIDGRRRIDPARALGAVGIERLRSLSLECAAKSRAGGQYGEKSFHRSIRFHSGHRLLLRVGKDTKKM